MTQYKYHALDDDGGPVEGTMEEDSAHRVTQKLRERGLTVNSVEALGRERGIVRVSRRLTWEDLELLSSQLAAVAGSGLPLGPAIEALSKDLRNPRMKPVLEGLRADLGRGATLEEAIAKQGSRFPVLYSSVVRAGEATGNLAGVLQTLSAHATRMVSVRNSIQLAMMYPLMQPALAVWWQITG